MTKQFFTEADCDWNRLYHQPYISLDKANRMVAVFLSKGKVVYGVESPNYGCHKYAEARANSDTHTAILINIQPIERDSERKILEDLMRKCEGIVMQPNSFTRVDLSDLYDRARALLGKG